MFVAIPLPWIINFSVHQSLNCYLWRNCPQVLRLFPPQYATFLKHLVSYMRNGYYLGHITRAGFRRNWINFLLHSNIFIGMPLFLIHGSKHFECLFMIYLSKTLDAILPCKAPTCLCSQDSLDVSTVTHSLRWHTLTWRYTTFFSCKLNFFSR